MQAESPAADLYPDPQLEHAEAPAAEEVPDAQVEQTVAADVPEYVPGTHCVHAEAPATEL